jgi:O-antigen ligase
MKEYMNMFQINDFSKSINIADSNVKKQAPGLRISFLWGMLWFWLGARMALPLLMRENLYLSSVFTTIINVSLSALIIFLLLTQVKRNSLKSHMFFFVLLFYLITIIATIISPALNGSNILRVVGLLTSSFTICIACFLCVKRMPPIMALQVMLRSLITGILLTTLLLIALNPSVTEIQNLGARFGDTDVLHPNTLGFIYAICLLGLLFLNIYPTVWRYFLALLFGVLLLLTLSKTSIIAALLATMVGWLVSRGANKLKSTFLYALLFIPIIIIFGDLVFERLEIYFLSPQALTLSGRIPLWEYVFQIVQERPLIGYGFGVFRYIVPASILGWNITDIAHAHNTVMDILFSSGYLGLISFIILLTYTTGLLIHGVLGSKKLPLIMPVLFVLLMSQSITNASLNLGIDFIVMTVIGLVSENILTNKHRPQSSMP